jgi:hypothetical protein
MKEALIQFVKHIENARDELLHAAMIADYDLHRPELDFKEACEHLNGIAVCADAGLLWKAYTEHAALTKKPADPLRMLGGRVVGSWAKTEAAKRNGSLGGLSTSDRKVTAARANGKMHRKKSSLIADNPAAPGAPKTSPGLGTDVI